MNISRVNPPLDYLKVASRSSLQNFELAHLNQTAQLRREIAVLLDQWVEHLSEAMVARFVIDHYDALHESTLPKEEVNRVLREASISPLPDVLLGGAALPPAPPQRAPYPVDSLAKARK